MDLTEGSETSAKDEELFIQPLKMDLTEGSETSAKDEEFFIQPLKMDLTEGSKTSAKDEEFFIQPLNMDLTEGSETSANHNLTQGKYPKEHIQRILTLWITLHNPTFQLCETR
jgi:hypothetical protein